MVGVPALPCGPRAPPRGCTGRSGGRAAARSSRGRRPAPGRARSGSPPPCGRDVAHHVECGELVAEVEEQREHSRSTHGSLAEARHESRPPPAPGACPASPSPARRRPAARGPPRRPRRQSGKWCTASPGIPARPAPSRTLRRQRTHADQHVHAGRRAPRPRADVSSAAASAQLQHVAEDGHAPALRRPGPGPRRRPRGHRGSRCSSRRAASRSCPSRRTWPRWAAGLDARRRLGHGLGVDAEAMSDGRGRQEVHDEMGATQWQRHVDRARPPRRRSKRIPKSSRASSRPRPRAAGRGRTRGRPPSRALSDAPHPRVVAVQHGDAAGTQPLEDLPLGLRDLVHRGEEPQVRTAPRW